MGFRTFLGFRATSKRDSSRRKGNKGKKATAGPPSPHAGRARGGSPAVKQFPVVTSSTPRRAPQAAASWLRS